MNPRTAARGLCSPPEGTKGRHRTAGRRGEQVSGPGFPLWKTVTLTAARVHLAPPLSPLCQGALAMMRPWAQSVPERLCEETPALLALPPPGHWRAPLSSARLFTDQDQRSDLCCQPGNTGFFPLKLFSIFFLI